MGRDVNEATGVNVAFKSPRQILHGLEQTDSLEAS